MSGSEAAYLTCKIIKPTKFAWFCGLIDQGFFVFRDQNGKALTNLWWAVSISVVLHISLLVVPDRPAGGTGGHGAHMSLSAVLQGVKPAVVAEAVGGEVQQAGLDDNIGSDAKDESAAGSNRLPGGGGIPDLLGVPLIQPTLPPLLPDKVEPFAPVMPEQKSYFRRSELSVAPVMQDEPLVDVSESLGRGQKGGKLALRLFISASGTVDRIEVLRGTLPSDVEELAMAAFLPVRFKPGEIDGVAVSSQLVFEIDLDGPAKGASRSSDQAPWNIGPKALGRPEGLRAR